jgi:hypothetical protein
MNDTFILALKLYNLYYISMLPQYKMALINGILSSLLLLWLIVSKYVFKRKINLLLLLILISVLPIVSIFRTGSYESGDLPQHVRNLMSFYNSLFSYHLIPRWAPGFNSGYGDPYFIFIYPLPYLVGSIFHAVGFSFLVSLKLVLASSFVISGLTMYFWAKEELGIKPGFVSSIFYLFMPYHLVDMHFRVTVAENLSFVFLPLILLAIKKVIENASRKWFLTLAISFGLLILSHQTISVMFLPIMICYCFFTYFKKQNKRFINLSLCFVSIILGFLLTSFYWMPILTFAKYIKQGLYPAYILFPDITQLLYSPWRFGFLFQGHKGELSYLIGYTQLLTVLLSSYLLFKKIFNKKLKNLLIFFLTITGIIFIMLLSVTRPIWEITPFLKYSQFSTRLLVPLALCISIIAGVVVSKINKTWFIVALCFLTIFYTIMNWGNRGTIPNINDDYFKKEYGTKQDIVGYEATFPIWIELSKHKPILSPNSNIEILMGEATIKEISRTPISHIYNINAQSDVQIKENTFFFPGWIVNSEKNMIPINYKNSQFPGIITFSLNRGSYNINVKYVDLPIIVLSKWLSGLSFLGLLLYVVVPKNYFPQRFK